MLRIHPFLNFLPVKTKVVCQEKVGDLAAANESVDRRSVHAQVASHIADPHDGTLYRDPHIRVLHVSETGHLFGGFAFFRRALAAERFISPGPGKVAIHFSTATR